MKRIQYSSYGGPELMRVDDFELPSPGKGEVAVRVKFAAINPIDWKLRNGQMKIVTGRAVGVKKQVIWPIMLGFIESKRFIAT